MYQTANEQIVHLYNTDGVVGAHYQKVKDFGDLMEQIANVTQKNMEKIK